MRDLFLSVRNKVIGSVQVPDIGEVFIRSLSLAEVKRLGEEKDPVNVFGLAVVLGASDKDGNRVFHDDDLPALLNKPFEMLQPIADAVTKSIALDDVKKN